MRDFYKTIEKTEINDNYDLEAVQIKAQYDRVNEKGEDLAQVLYDMFRYGYALGSRAEKAKLK